MPSGASCGKLPSLSCRRRPVQSRHQAFFPASPEEALPVLPDAGDAKVAKVRRRNHEGIGRQGDEIGAGSGFDRPDNAALGHHKGGAARVERKRGADGNGLRGIEVAAVRVPARHRSLKRHKDIVRIAPGRARGIG